MAERRGLTADFREALKVRETEQAIYMADGKCKTHEDYRMHCGIVQGLRLARDEFYRVVKRYLDETED
jgi:hypothetical protein